MRRSTYSNDGFSSAGNHPAPPPIGFNVPNHNHQPSAPVMPHMMPHIIPGTETLLSSLKTSKDKICYKNLDIIRKT